MENLSFRTHFHIEIFISKTRVDSDLLNSPRTNDNYYCLYLFKNRARFTSKIANSKLNENLFALHISVIFIAYLTRLPRN